MAQAPDPIRLPLDAAAALDARSSASGGPVRCTASRSTGRRPTAWRSGHATCAPPIRGPASGCWRATSASAANRCRSPAAATLGAARCPAAASRRPALLRLGARPDRDGRSRPARDAAAVAGVARRVRSLQRLRLVRRGAGAARVQPGRQRRGPVAAGLRGRGRRLLRRPRAPGPPPAGRTGLSRPGGRTRRRRRPGWDPR